MEIQAFAKLNLTLDILGKREDGYHDLRMVMQSITLAGHPHSGGEPGGGWAAGERQSALSPHRREKPGRRAALRFWEALGREPENLDIRIEKRIPVCAGMAGGSSDAAAVLRALNRRAGEPFSPRELAKIGERVGSDVPYCVLGGTALAEGRGEMLTPAGSPAPVLGGGLQARLPHLHPGAVRPGRPGEAPPPAGHRRTGGRPGGGGPGGACPGGCTTSLRTCSPPASIPGWPRSKMI